MVGRAEPYRRENDASGLLLGEGNEILEVGGRQPGIHHQQERRVHPEADRSEILDRVVRHLRIDRRTRCEASGSSQQNGVTVGGRLGGKAMADRRARSGAIVHHDLLSERLGQPRGERAPGRVGRSARRIGHDHADRPHGVLALLRQDRSGEPYCGQEKDQQSQPRMDHCGLPILRHPLLVTVPAAASAAPPRARSSRE